MPQHQTHQWDVPFGVLMSEGPLRLVGCFYPSLARFFFSIILTATKHMSRPLGLFLWIENETKCLSTRFLQPYFTD